MSISPWAYRKSQLHTWAHCRRVDGNTHTWAGTNWNSFWRATPLSLSLSLTHTHTLSLSLSGADWNTSISYNKAIQPKVVVKAGKMVDPIDKPSSKTSRKNMEQKLASRPQAPVRPKAIS